MDKKGFKIGDRVKLKEGYFFGCRGKTLTVTAFENGYVYVIWDGINAEYFPLYPDEIESAVKVGEQLLFSFMRGG